MAVLKINYNNTRYKQLALNTFLGETLKTGASAPIIEHITRYHSQNGDTCQIDDFEVTSSTLQEDKKNGNVIISYLIQYHYGCADITRQAKDHETWKFELDENSGTVYLHMPEYEVRSTVDEF